MVKVTVGKEKSHDVDNPSGGLFRAFANRDYTRLWSTNCLTYVSRWMQITLMAWLVLELTDSPWSVALVGFFYMFPTLGLGLAGGVLADEMDRRWLLIITQAVGILASLWLTLLLISEAVRVWQVYSTALINGAAWAMGFSGRRNFSSFSNSRIVGSHKIETAYPVHR